MLFQVLNTTDDKRSKALDEQIAAFPYINGKLFEESLPLADFDAPMREALLDACAMTGVDEVVILSTCNRTELYVVVPEGAILADKARELIDWETITEMRPSSVLINASHAGLVDTGDALAFGGALNHRVNAFRALQRAAVVGDDDELGVLAHVFQHQPKAVDVGLVQGRVAVPLETWKELREAARQQYLKLADLDGDLSRLSVNWPLERMPAIDRALATSGLTVLRAGAYAPTREEIR